MKIKKNLINIKNPNTGQWEQIPALQGEKGDTGDNKVGYATCSTAADVAEKILTIADTNWKLELGSIITVDFDVSNTASNVTLNVNGTGAYPIWYNGSEYTSTSSTYAGHNTRPITYLFNGTHWVWLNIGYYPSTPTNPSLGHGYGTCTTAEATLAKVCTISSYTLSAGGSVSIKFTNAVPANSTLNIRTRGAKKIFYKGSAITNGIIKAGDTATFVYDGTQYHLISIDGEYAPTSYVNNLSEKINELSVFVTPQMFGAKGDNTTDDTVAMQNAFNHVATNGGYLFIPKGRYKVTSPITVDWSSTSTTKRNFLQKIVGAGSQAFEKYYDNSVIVGYNIPANRGVIELIGNGNTWGTETRIEDLGIECDEATCDTMSFALKYGDARNFKLSRVKLRGHNGILARCGSIVDESGNSTTKGYEQINVKFEQCDFYTFASNTKGFAFLPEGIITGHHAVMDNIVVDSCCINGVWVINSVNALFQSCHVAINNVLDKEITTNNVGLLNGYEIDYATGFYIGQVMSAVFQNCYFEDYRRGIQITPTIGNIRNVSIMNCYINPGCNQFNLDGSRLCADYGIRINSGMAGKEVRNVLIQNNVFRLVEGDTEFNIANVSNEFANRFVFRDNCTTSTQVVPKVVNTTETGYDICNGVTEGSSIKEVTTTNDGKELTIRLTNGLSYTIKGSTPTKGVDYFTEAEIEEITETASALAKAELQQIAPPTWVEKVADMIDTSKHYVLQSSGNIWAYMTKTKTVPGSTVPNFTNLMDNSNSYVLNGQRYSHSSAAFKSQETDCAIVVPIPAASSYTFRVRGATMTGCSYPTSVYFGTTNQTFPNIPTNSGTVDLNYKNESNGDAVINVLKPPSGCSYAVFHVAKVTDTSALIVTVNEEITYKTTDATTTTVTEWTDTGHNIVK